MPLVETRLGDRLDLLAGEYLKDPLKWERIIAENPGLNLTSEFYLPSGLKLKIPELVPDKIADLLPWDRQDEDFSDPGVSIVVPPDVQPGANQTDILSGGGWLTPQQIRLLLSLSEQKTLTGLTAATDNATVEIAHNLDSTKITSVRGLVFFANGLAVPLSSRQTGYGTFVTIDATNVVIKNELGNSNFVLAKPLTITIEYKL